MSGEPACFNLPVDTVVTVALGLGTNLGDREDNLRDAVARIGELVDIDALSSIYESDAVGYAEQPPFLNMVVRARTDLPALQLMHELLRIEAAMGRERSFRNAPRIIDIDLLLYDDVVTSIEDLDLPHPRLHQRAFVLKPLLEVMSDARDPRTGRPYAELMAESKLADAIIVAPPLQAGHETR